MDGLRGLPRSGLLDVQVFRCSADDWQEWRKRPGTSGVMIFGVGGGGKGGAGAVGANSTAAGGGGGASGGQSVAHFSGFWVPENLYVRPGAGAQTGGGSANNTYVSIAPDTTANNLLLRASPGGNGGAASGATAGSAGSAGGTSAIATCPLAGMGQYFNLTGQVGIIGGAAVTGGAITLPVTGLVVTGGAGGGGLPAAAASGTSGGSISGNGAFPAYPGAVFTSSATTPGRDGNNGYQPVDGLTYFYGGTGGGSSHGSATGAGLVGGRGGDGGPGCGGGGGGGALTGSVQGLGGNGGDGFVIIVSY